MADHPANQTEKPRPTAAGPRPTMTGRRPRSTSSPGADASHAVLFAKTADCVRKQSNDAFLDSPLADSV
jgi:hypothetical protein